MGWIFGRKQEKNLSLYDKMPPSITGDVGTVIVIGAGAAGLTAARVLQDNGCEVVVIEGRERIGGRLHTVDFDGTLVDEGGNWIHGVPENPLYHLALEAGITTREEDFGHPLRLKVFDSGTGRFVNVLRALYMLFRANSLVGRMTNESVSAQHEETSLEERFDKEIANINGKTNQRLFQFGLRAVVDLTMAENSRFLHPNSLAINPDWEGTDDHVIHGGYKELINRLADGLDIRLGNRVEEISYDDDGITIVTDQETYQGSHVIVTIPLGVLKKNVITFNPPLPKSKTQAIENLGFGNVEKIFLKFDTAFWRSSPKTNKHLFHVSDEIGDIPAFLDLTNTSSQPLLACLISGDQSRQFAKDPEVMIERATQILKQMFPDVYQEPTAVHISNWQKDEFAGGSYSVPTLNTSPEDYDELAKPIGGRVLFAGEATYREHGGFVEGAMGSGVREARRILGKAVDLVIPKR